jgi:hypothetical protein
MYPNSRGLRVQNTRKVEVSLAKIPTKGYWVFLAVDLEADGQD